MNINNNFRYRPIEIPPGYEMPESLRDAVYRLGEILHVPVLGDIPPLSSHSFQSSFSARLKEAYHPALMVGLIQEAAPLFSNEEWVLCFQSIADMEKEGNVDVKKMLEFAAREMTGKGAPRPANFSPLQVAELIEIGGRYNVFVQRFVSLVFDEALLHVKKFNTEELYKVMEGARTWRVNNESRECFIESLLKGYFLRCGSLSLVVKEMPLKLMASLYRLLVKECQDVENPVKEELFSRLKECSATDLTEILRAILDGKQFDKEGVIAVAERIKEIRDSIDPMEYGTLLQELTRVNYCDDQWFQEVIAKKFPLPQQLMVLNAIVKTGYCADEAKASALEIIQQKELEECPFGQQTLFMVVFGFLFGQAHQELSHAQIERLKSSPQLSSIDRSKLYQAMLLTGYPPQEALTYLTEPQKLSFHTSNFQKQVGEIILEMFKRKNKNVTLEEEVLIGNTHVDILVKGATCKGKPLIFQIDGPFHYTLSANPEMVGRQTMQTIVNTRVLSALGYHVFRVGLYGEKRFSKDLFIS